jgi:hypothetical protein
MPAHSAICTFGISPQFIPARGKWTPERHAIDHTFARFKAAGMGANVILEFAFLSENAHRTAATEG